MTTPEHANCRYFLSYSGVKLPLKLVNPLDEGDLEHRNTYIRAYFDGSDRLVGCDKLVYGDVQISHRYEYHGNGTLSRAEITMDEDLTVMNFDEAGKPKLSSCPPPAVMLSVAKHLSAEDGSRCHLKDPSLRSG